MRFLRVLGILFYSVIIVLIGLTLMIAAIKIRLLPIQDLNNLILNLSSQIKLRLSVGGIGLILVVIGYIFPRFILGRFQSEKTIAFPTSSGEVTVALSAVEDLIKRLTGIIPEIKELRPDVIAKTKKGIIIDLKVILKSEANIPELTNRLQELVRYRVQEILPVEEQITIKIHIIKIISAEEKDRKRKEPEKTEPTIPYGGYGRL